MSITVSCEFRVREGHVDAVIRQTVEHLAIPAPGRRHPRLYQHLDDVTRLLYIGDWESRRAFENFRLTTSMPVQLNAFSSFPECRIYQRLALFEHVFRPSSVAYADVIEGPPESHAQRRELLLRHHRARTRERRNLVTLITCERIDQANGLLMMSELNSAAVGHQLSDAGDAALFDQLRAAGDTVSRFVGRPLLQVPAFPTPV